MSPPVRPSHPPVDREAKAVDPCPSDDDLARFLLGDGPAPAGVGAHLGLCATCQSAADRIAGASTLRDWLPTGPGASRSPRPEADPGLDRLIRRLRAESIDGLGRRAGETTEGGAGGSRPEVALGPPSRPGDLGSIGPFDVEAEVGRGGMGIVFRARDRTMGRVVALKVVRPGLSDDRSRRRFVQEVRAAARVDHDHIVRPYATSDPDDPAPYFAMEYLDGPTLADLAASADRPGPGAMAEMVAQAADGLAAAHAAGLVHRDVKPANILVESATGRAKVGDFGLARLVSDAAGPTREGVIAGTPAYLSPESARGEGEVDARSDVYALGATLYECLTGSPPFRGVPHRVIRQVLDDEPPRPRTLNDAIPRDLETIALKAMAREPGRRYPSAAELSADLRRFLRGEPILARPAGRVERGWRWCRNNRRVAALASAVLLLAAALACGATAAAIRIARERNEARAQARLAEDRGALALEAFTDLVAGVQDRLGARPGTLQLRRSLLETAVAGLRKIAAAGEARATPRSLAAMLKLGDVELLLGRSGPAAATFQRAAALAAAAVAADPRSIPLRREWAAARDRVVETVGQAAPLDEQIRSAEEILAIRAASLAERPDDPELRRDLYISHGKLGDIRSIRRDFAGATESHRAALALISGPIPDGPGRAIRLSDLRFTLTRIGREATHRKDFGGALAAFRDALARADALVDLDPGNLAYLRDHAAALDGLGMAAMELGDLDTAVLRLEGHLAERRRLSEADSADQLARRTLAMAHQHLGECRRNRREFDASRASNLAALAIDDELARLDPQSQSAPLDRLIVLRQLVDLEFDAGRYDEAGRHADRAIDGLRSAATSPPLPDRDLWIAEFAYLRDLSRILGRCIDDPALARAQERMCGDILRLRARVLARSGRHAEALSAARELLGLAGDPQAPIDAARTFALVARSLPEADREARSAAIRESVDVLRKIVPTTPGLAAQLPWDADFAALRDDPGFRAITR